MTPAQVVAMLPPPARQGAHAAPAADQGTPADLLMLASLHRA